MYLENQSSAAKLVIGDFLIFPDANQANSQNSTVTMIPGNTTVKISGRAEKLLMPSMRMSIATNGSVRKALRIVPIILPSREITPNRRAKERRSCPAEKPRVR